MDLPEGDPLRGRNVSLRYSCRPCHFVEDYENFALPFTATDDLPSVLERGELRINDPKYTGKATNNLEYFFESVYLPTAYIVPGDFQNVFRPTVVKVRETVYKRNGAHLSALLLNISVN